MLGHADEADSPCQAAPPLFPLLLLVEKGLGHGAHDVSNYLIGHDMATVIGRFGVAAVRRQQGRELFARHRTGAMNIDVVVKNLPEHGRTALPHAPRCTRCTRVIVENPFPAGRKKTPMEEALRGGRRDG